MNKPKFETPDMVERNIEKLGELFPNCITEARGEDGKLKKAVNFEMLQQILSTEFPPEGARERYEFTWVGKRAAIVEANKPIRKTLRPCKAESKNWDTTENLYIEGDNLEVLKLLQESYLGKVKMIYIDPPYNTGNDFIYHDDFKQTEEEYEQQSGTFDEEENRLFKNTETNGRFHSDWCSMMYSRLTLAKNFLSDDGLLFISIDDNEECNLKCLCDEIFGQENCIAVLPTIMNLKGNQDEFGFAGTHEYILCYGKNKTKAEINALKIDEEDIDDWLEDDKGYYKKGATLKRTGIDAPREKRPYSFYPILIKEDKIYSIQEDEYTKIYNKDSKNFDDQFVKNLMDKYQKEGFIVLLPIIDNKFVSWRWGYNKVKNEVDEIIIIKENKNYSLYKKQRPSIGDMPTVKPKSVLYKPEYSSGNGTSQLKKIFENKVFDNPKPVELLKDLIEIATQKNNIILDFFPGSATTAHAVMQLNAEDGGHRKFIMVQLPEVCDENSEAFKAGYKNICEIGKERIRRAGEKIKADNPLTTQDLDVGFRVFKVDSSNMNDVYYSAGEYTQEMLAGLEDNIKSDRTDLDLLFGCLLDWGLPISLPYTSEQIETCTVHTYNDGDLIACFEENVPESVIKEIAKRKPLRAVFRDAGFGSSPEKINVTEIFKMLAPDTDVKVI